MISSKSRYASEYRRYQRTQRRMMASSECRPRNSAGRFRITGTPYQIRSARLQHNRLNHYVNAGVSRSLLKGLLLHARAVFKLARKKKITAETLNDLRAKSKSRVSERFLTWTSAAGCSLRSAGEII